MQQGVQTDATCNIQQCCVRLHAALALFVLSHNSKRIFAFEDNEHNTSSRFREYALFVLKFNIGLMCFCIIDNVLK